MLNVLKSCWNDESRLVQIVLHMDPRVARFARRTGRDVVPEEVARFLAKRTIPSSQTDQVDVLAAEIRVKVYGSAFDVFLEAEKYRNFWNECRECVHSLDLLVHLSRLHRDALGRRGDKSAEEGISDLS